MALLEVHDGPGRVRRVSVARDQTLLFGSSPKCDLVLDDPAVLPFHGRLRWKRDRLKADASPQAEYIVVNGRKMASASFRQGDEIQVGSSRIFLIQLGGDDPAETAGGAVDDGTRVQPPPHEYPAGGGGERPLIAEEFALEPDEYEVEEDEDEGPLPVPVPVPEPHRQAEAIEGRSAPLPRLWRSSSRTEPEGGGETAAAGHDRGEPSPRAPGFPQRLSTGWGGLIRSLRGHDAPPGEERILSSPLVITLVVALVFLVLASVALWGIIQRTIASRLYNQAIDFQNEGEYPNALLRFDEFLERYPADARAGRARVLRALANVRQFTGSTGTSWAEALAAERAMVRTLSREPAYRDSSTELADLILKTAEGLAERARGSADSKTLAEAESALALHAKVAGKAAATLLGRSRVPAKLAEAHAAVRKAAVRAQALAAMDAALRAGSSAGVYAARDALIGQYGDLAEDAALVARMRDANELIRRAVTVDPSGRPAETEPQADPLGPPTSLVLRAAPAAQTQTPRAAAPAPAGGDAIVHALADGFAYGLAAADGAPVWQVPLGLAAPFPPQPIPGSAEVLAVDARFDELVKLAGRTGALLWRQALGEPVSDPPLILGNQVIQPTPGGKLLLIDLESGALRATVNFGVPLGRTPLSDERGQFLYVVGERDCLFVLRRDPLACAAVEYLGHAAGSVAAAPARLGRFLVVAENHTPTDGRLRVFVIDEDGTKLRPVQQVDVPGWTWSTPASAGSVLWATGDRAGAAAFALGTYEQRDPLRLLARISPDADASGPAFALARSERELIVGSGRSARLELDAENGTIKAAWTLAEAGPAVAPPQAAGDLLVLSQQATEGPGVTLWGIEPATGTVRWRTILGAPWRTAPAAAPGGDVLITLAEDGTALELAGDRLATGGFVALPLPRPGGTRLPPGPLLRLAAGEVTVLVPSGETDHVLVRAGASGDKDKLERIELPAPLEAAPVVWRDDLVAAAVGGRAFLLDPATGKARAEPYVAPFDRAHPTHWCRPVLAGDTLVLADRSGRVLQLRRAEGPRARPRLAVAAEARLGSALLADPLGMADAVILVTAENQIRALAARDLTPIGAWPLEAPLAGPPANVGGRGFLADVAGRVLAFGPDGQRLWSITLRAGAAAGLPAILDDSVWFLTQSGALECHALADGALRDHLDLDVLPAGNLLAVDSQLAVPVGLSTLRLLKNKP
jgi:outer membrane protein assembly factor BamB